MREVVGDLFEYPADCLVVPVNWVTKGNGLAVMGAGVAKQAAERWPRLAVHLGGCIRRHPELPSVVAFPVRDDLDVACVPTKRHYRDPSTISDIEAHLPWLIVKADARQWQTVALPRLGCGLRTGRLNWSDVRPVLARYFDDRFVVVSREGEGCKRS